MNSGVIWLVISSEFARKQGFKLKKIERPINVRNVNCYGTLNTNNFLFSFLLFFLILLFFFFILFSWKDDEAGT